MPEVFFNGPSGRIEGKYTQSDDKNAPLALVLHPHPLYGGTMNNKVVFSLYKTLADNGYTTLRINFRGVGKSQGQFDNGVGELTDAATALDWMQLQNPSASSYLIAGFSFGAWVGMQLIMRRPEINSFIAVSPPVNKHDFSFLSPCPIPGIFVQGNRDSIVPEDEVMSMYERLSKQRKSQIAYQVINGADHFYRERLHLLEEVLNNHLRGEQTPTSTEVESEGVQSKHKVLLD